MTAAGLPALKPRELIRAIERAGFRLLRKSKGSHWQFEHRMVGGPRSPFTGAATSALASCARSSAILRWMNRS